MKIARQTQRIITMRDGRIVGDTAMLEKSDYPKLREKNDW
jgi:hypothetical protein